MRYCLPVTPLILLVLASTLQAGFQYNQNFTVFTPPQPTQDESEDFAKQVLARAEQYRRQIAREWLGVELPPGVGKTTINVAFSDTKDAGLTWAKDSPTRRHHMLYLTTSPQRALGTTLAHEMVHVVLATQFPHPNRLPAWLEEGIASRYDDQPRIDKRQQIIAWFEGTGNWPRITNVLWAENIRASEPADYAVAASLTDFLIARGGKKTLIRFGRDIGQNGLEAALRQHFEIRNLDELQTAWQAWVSQSNQVASSGPGGR